MFAFTAASARSVARPRLGTCKPSGTTSPKPATTVMAQLSSAMLSRSPETGMVQSSPAMRDELDLAQRALDHLLLHESVDGIRFGPIPQILFTADASKTPRIEGQVYINLGTRWTVFASRPVEFPTVENDLPEVSQGEEFKRICDLRQVRVQKVELGSNA